MQELGFLDRFGKEVGSTLAHGFDGLVDGTVGGQNDHRKLMIASPQSAKKLDPVHLGHAEIRDDEVE